MSRLRLPLLAEEPGEIPPLDDGLRMPFSVPSIALLAGPRADGLAALASLREAITGAARTLVELEVVTRDGPARRTRTERGQRVEASLFDIPDALAGIDGALGRDTLLLATGAAVVAIRRPTLSVLVTGGALSSEWGADARSVRERLDLIVPELDAVLARELVARLPRR